MIIFNYLIFVLFVFLKPFYLLFEMYISLSILLHCLAQKDLKGESRNKCNTFSNISS